MNTQLKTTLSRAPWLSALILALAALFLQYVPLFLFPGLPNFWQKLIGKIIIALMAIALISVLGWWRETKFIVPNRLQMWLPFLPLLLLPALSAWSSDFYKTDLLWIVIYIFYVLIVGFVEEAIARGLFMRILQPYGMWRSILLSSFLFGLMHFGNLLIGANLGKTIVQVCYATLIGIAFAGTWTAGKTIWPLILIHALIDFFPKLDVPTSGESSISLSSALILIGVPIPFALYGLWIAKRQSKINHQTGS